MREVTSAASVSLGLEVTSAVVLHCLQVRVVIIGHDPSHDPDEACGLSFGVPPGTHCPPGLLNIFDELRNDVGCTSFPNGDLSSWADQGVLLLNSVSGAPSRL